MPFSAKCSIKQPNGSVIVTIQRGKEEPRHTEWDRFVSTFPRVLLEGEGTVSIEDDELVLKNPTYRYLKELRIKIPPTKIPLLKQVIKHQLSINVVTPASKVGDKSLKWKKLVLAWKCSEVQSKAKCLAEATA